MGYGVVGRESYFVETMAGGYRSWKVGRSKIGSFYQRHKASVGEHRDCRCSLSQRSFVIVTGKSVVDWMISRGEEFSARDAEVIGWHDGKRLVAGVARS